jgi:hypothetical protein
MLLLNLLEDGRAPALDVERIHRMKFALVLFPLGATLGLAAALRAEVAAAQNALLSAMPVTHDEVPKRLVRAHLESLPDSANLRTPRHARRQPYR